MVLVKSTSSPKGQSLARSTLGSLPALELCECPFMMFGIADRTSSPCLVRLGDESMLDMVGGAAQCEEACIIGVT